MSSHSPGKSRREFVRTGLAASFAVPAVAQISGQRFTGDTAILRFSTAAEIIAADIWSQMADLVAANTALRTAMTSVDSMLPRIITEIARNERSHAEFLMRYYNTTAASGQAPLNLEAFKTLPTASPIGAAVCSDGSTGSTTGTSAGTTGTTGAGTANATGSATSAQGCIPLTTGALPGTTTQSQATGRLTSLANVNVDTSWFYKYHSSLSVDLTGQTFPQITTPGTSLTGIALTGSASSSSGSTGTGAGGTASTGATGAGGTVAPTTPAGLAQAALLFASMLEQMEASTYLALSGKLTNPELMSVMGSIMPIEMVHFTALQIPLQRFTDAMNGGSLYGAGAASGGTGSGTSGTGSGGTGSGSTGSGGTGSGGTGSGSTGSGGTGSGGTGSGSGSGSGGSGSGSGSGGSGSGSGSGGTGSGSGSGGSDSGSGSGGSGSGSGSGGSGSGSGSGGSGSGSGSGGSGGGSGSGGSGGGSGSGGSGGSGGGGGGGFAPQLVSREDVSGGTGTATTGSSALTSQGFFAMQFPATQSPFFQGGEYYPQSILPVPALLLPGMPYVAAVRPRMAPQASATRQVQALIAANLFQGQPAAFITMLMQMAADADAAVRAGTTG